MPVIQGRSLGLAEFLAWTCLSYCEFYELWQSGYVSFSNGNATGTKSADDATPAAGAFPECPPCCPDDFSLEFPDGQQEGDLAKLHAFVRLWRTLRASCQGGYSFAELRDICDVLGLETGGALNSHLIRGLAAFQMLRDDFGLPLTDPAAQPAPGAVDAERSQLLALWTAPGSGPWAWAVRELIAGAERNARQRHGARQRPTGFVTLLTANLDPLSRLAGFDPDSTTDCWHAAPTHTLRFAEVLAKIYASRFSVGELIFFCTSAPHWDGDDPFPLQDDNDALDLPLGLPDDDHEHTLWRLRSELLAARVEPDEADEWPWPRIETALHAEFGFETATITALARHFFPAALTRSGGPGPDGRVAPPPAPFTAPLAPGDTSAAMWNDPPDGPFRYEADADGGETDRVRAADRPRGHREADGRPRPHRPQRQAVQDLFFAPRAMLAGFALLFADFADAQRILVEEPDEAERFAFFRHQFLLCRHRCHAIARHLARHVTAVTGQEQEDGEAVATLIARTMAADENTALSSWDDESSTPPTLTWPLPAGNAFAALLGLAGTGLPVEYLPAGGPVAWRDVSGALGGFGRERDRENCPVPTVLPSFATTLTPPQLPFASVHNGFLMKDSTDSWLGGAQGFTATWSGALLIEQDGSYEFWACPRPTTSGQTATWLLLVAGGSCFAGASGSG